VGGRREGFGEGGVEAVDADDERLAQIITAASVGSYMRRATAGLTYNTNKAAAAHLGKMLATMLAEWGVRSNVIAPGRQFDFFWSSSWFWGLEA
jgi:NAD(P)-dependent dehydrogenase (short-subunit alcohol dehydrogenase family)